MVFLQEFRCKFSNLVIEYQDKDSYRNVAIKIYQFKHHSIIILKALIYYPQNPSQGFRRIRTVLIILPKKYQLFFF